MALLATPRKKIGPAIVAPKQRSEQWVPAVAPKLGPLIFGGFPAVSVENLVGPR